MFLAKSCTGPFGLQIFVGRLNRGQSKTLYQVSGITNCVYRRQQLQVVSDDETKGVQRKFIIDKLLRRFTEKRVVKYEVLWSGGEKTIEPRAHLMKDVPQLVLEFEAKKEKRD